ncbi:MAG: antitoxin VbhA family protein [Janthinobacterium lividum]
MSSTFFKPAQPGLNAAQTAARQERERHATNAISILLSNGPAPSPESLELMQRFVDGELTLDQVDELTRARLQAKYSNSTEQTLPRS